MKRIFLMLFIFIALVTVANAAVLYKCIDSNGNKIITDNPPSDAKCESRDEENESASREGLRTDVYSYPKVNIGNNSPRAEVNEGLVYTYYIVNADPTRSLLGTLNTSSSIRQNGQVFHAYTNWDVKWNFWWFENPDGRCRITRVTTKLAGSISLPRLVGASSTLRNQFDKYLAAVRVHELGHYGIGKEAASVGILIIENILMLQCIKNENIY